MITMQDVRELKSEYELVQDTVVYQMCVALETMHAALKRQEKAWTMRLGLRSQPRGVYLADAYLREIRGAIMPENTEELFVKCINEMEKK